MPNSITQEKRARNSTLLKVEILLPACKLFPIGSISPTNLASLQIIIFGKGMVLSKVKLKRGISEYSQGTYFIATIPVIVLYVSGLVVCFYTSEYIPIIL